MTKRIVTLLPSATEIVCALGARAELVGVSHECDFPADVAGLPRLTKPKFDPKGSSAEIHANVQAVLQKALGVYDVDVAKLESLAPDVVVTQDQCDVCAVSLAEVREALSKLAKKDVELVSLHPMRLADVWSDVGRVAQAIGRGAESEALLAGVRARLDAVRERAAHASDRLPVVTIEWLDPVMLGGTWMPELVELVNGEALGVKAGEKAPTVTREQLEALSPELVVIKPCGFDVKRTTAELPALKRNLPWDSWDAVLHDRVYVADGNAYFNRPGPRLVDSAEILAACVHPKLFRDFHAKHEPSVVEVDADLTLRAWQ